MLFYRLVPPSLRNECSHQGGKLSTLLSPNKTHCMFVCSAQPVHPTSMSPVEEMSQLTHSCATNGEATQSALLNEWWIWKALTKNHVTYFHVSKTNAKIKTENPISNHFVLWESFDTMERSACSGPWSLGWLCKTERYNNRTDLSTSIPSAFSHYPTPGPRKSYCKTLKKGKMLSLSKHVHFFSNFTGLTAKSSCIYGCLKCEIVLRLCLHAGDRYNDPSGENWILML